MSESLEMQTLRRKLERAELEADELRLQVKGWQVRVECLEQRLQLTLRNDNGRNTKAVI